MYHNIEKYFNIVTTDDIKYWLNMWGGVVGCEMGGY